ncbi:hypothetical protein CAC42_311 [Sphaceloma murrayae]|uniref:Zn(2)-C6 fungal-type domain-containing protein n=1 Tax=Sphaceloma murrayae TaxID=2082308 RepID=A0A2K1QZV7_9PEZI|nr:hypothetical protein CAC42_311 [Sphaceloma murrayae]
MDAISSLAQSQDARPQKRRRGNGTASTDMQLDPHLQHQPMPQPAPLTPVQSQLAEYNSSVRQQQTPIQQDYQPEMRQIHPSESHDYPRRRAMIACEVCRGRKTRCDGAKPRCRLCTELNAECIYREPGQKLDAGDKMILEQLQRIENMLHDGYQATHSNVYGDRQSVPDSSSHKNGSLSQSSRGGVGGVIAGQDSTGHSHPSNDATAPTLFQQLLRAKAMEPILSNVKEASALLAESQRSRLVFPQRPALDASDITSHVDDYFQVLHQYHATVNAETWQAIYATASLNGFSKGVESSTVLLIAALGWTISNGNKLYNTQQEENLGFLLFSQAWGLLPELVSSGGVLSIQCLFFGSAYLLSTFRPLDAWYTLNLASSKLQTELMFSEESSSSEAESLKRLYWNIEQLRTDISSSVEVERTPQSLSRLPGLPSGYSQDTQLAQHSNDSTFLTPRIGLQRLSQRAGSALPYSPSRHVNVDALLPLAHEYIQQLDRWYELLPEGAKFQQDAPTSSTVESDFRLGFFACRAMILRPLMMEVMRDGSLLLDHTIRECCKQGLEASVRQIENTIILYTGHLRCTWKTANDMAAETLFVMGATLSPGLAALLPPADDMDRIIGHVISTLEELATLSPCLSIKVTILRSAEKERKPGRARQIEY